MEKSKQILDKHLKLQGWEKSIIKESNLYNTIVDAMEEAINYSQCCKVENEQLVCERCKQLNDNDCSICYDCTEEIQKLL